MRDRLRARLRAAVTVLLMAPVHLWRATVLVRQPRCRFHPSCSTYALEALRVHGPVRGAGLAVRRVGRCHPWNPGGVDHVPPTRAQRELQFATAPPKSSDDADRGADPAVRSPR